MPRDWGHRRSSGSLARTSPGQEETPVGRTTRKRAIDGPVEEEAEEPPTRDQPARPAAAPRIGHHHRSDRSERTGPVGRRRHAPRSDAAHRMCVGAIRLPGLCRTLGRATTSRPLPTQLRAGYTVTVEASLYMQDTDKPASRCWPPRRSLFGRSRAPEAPAAGCPTRSSPAWADHRCLIGRARQPAGHPPGAPADPGDDLAGQGVRLPAVLSRRRPARSPLGEGAAGACDVDARQRLGRRSGSAVPARSRTTLEACAFEEAMGHRPDARHRAQLSPREWCKRWGL